MAALNSFVADILHETTVAGGGSFSLSSSSYAAVAAMTPSARPADIVEVLTSSAAFVVVTFTHQNGSSINTSVASGAPLVRVSHPYTGVSASDVTQTFRLVWLRRAGDR
jgi:hypothetical protein